jgi:hypothetical protein
MMHLDPKYLALAIFLVPLGCSSPDHAGAGSGGGSATGGGATSGEGTVTSGGGAASSGSNGVGGSSASTSSGSTGGPDLPPPALRGATLPYWEYEAEAATTTGTLLDASRAQGDLAAESSGRRAVRLDATGQHIDFKLEHPTSSIVVRYAMPDAPGGGGIDATLGLYINGVRKQSLALTSRYAWLYGGEADSISNNPGGGAHHFFDEAHALIGDVPAGATITLQKDGEDTAAYYVIDLVDFEQVAPPLARPAGSLSLTDFGATPDDGQDDGAAIQKAIDAAKSQGKVLWIPEGTFDSASTPFVVSGVTIQGAGMWYSTLHGASAQFKVSGNDNKFHDFALFGEVTARHDDKGENGFDGPAGTGSRLENIWIEHEKCGYWVGKGAYPGAPDKALTDGLVIHGIRVRDTFADGVNLCNGTRGSVVEQSHFRNTGDDAIAFWSPSFDGIADENNIARFNTVQLPWRANCFAIYGGKDGTIEDSVCADTAEYPGVLISSGFSSRPFDGTTRVQRTTLTRAGGSMYNQEHGALKLFADQGPITNLVVQDLIIADPTYSGIHVQGPNPVTGSSLDGVQVSGAGAAGILINSNAQGGAQASNVTVTGSAKAALQNDAPGAWTFQKGAGNAGW